MRYEIILSGTSELLGSFEREPEDRPHPGDIIKLNGRLERFKITRSIPSNNPATQKVQYVVEYESDRNLINGGGIAEFDNYYLRAKTISDDVYCFGTFRWPG